MRFVVRVLLVLALVGSGVLGSAGTGTAATLSPHPDTVTVEAGHSARVNVLANDVCSGGSGPCYPALVGVRATSPDHSVGVTVDPTTKVVRVSVAAAHAAGVVTLPYTVAKQPGGAELAASTIRLTITR